MRDVFFVSQTELQARLAVSLISYALPTTPLDAVEQDHDGALRVLVDVPAGYAMRELRERPRSLSARTVVVTGNSSVLYADAMRSFGVLTTVRLTDSRATVAFKLERALAGERSEESYEVLTSMQARVLRGLLAGASTSDIAASLTLSAKTLSAHISAILRASGIPDRAALVARVLGGAA